MLGFTKLTPEEKAEHERKKRVLELNTKLQEETTFRQHSLARSEKLQQELESLEK